MRRRPEEPAGCLAQVLGFLAAVVGGGLVAVTVLTAMHGERNGVPAPDQWAGGPLHLHTYSRQLQTCRVSPPDGPPYEIVVPYGSTEKWAGVLVETAPGTRTLLRCTDAVLATTGPVLALYPLAKHDFWVIVPALTLASVGVVYGRPFQQRRPRS